MDLLFNTTTLVNKQENESGKIRNKRALPVKEVNLLTYLCYVRTDRTLYLKSFCCIWVIKYYRDNYYLLSQKVISPIKYH